jgi:hypothetical protein
MPRKTTNEDTRFKISHSLKSYNTRRYLIESWLRDNHKLIDPTLKVIMKLNNEDEKKLKLNNEKEKKHE